MTPKETYVNAEIAIMKLASTETELIEQWKGEQENRALLRLTSDEWPGLDLLAAFKAQRIKLQQDSQT